MELYLLVPEFSTLAATLIIAIVAYGVANVIIVACRFSAAKAMKKCFPDLLPAQQYLLPSDTTLEAKTKARYYRFFAEKIPDFQVHKLDKDMRPIVFTAIDWLISQTRDTEKFALIAEENINFGFACNLFVLKPYGVATTAIGTILNVSALLCLTFEFHKYLLILVIIIHILFLLMWLFIVNKDFVKKSGRNYARALLSACDSQHLNDYNPNRA